MAGVQLVVAYVIWPECKPGEMCKWPKTQQEVFQDVVYDRVPKLKKFSEGHDFSYIGTSKARGARYKPQRDCVQWLVDGF
eukprot:CAMPEP_0119382648 /NCGR_PEP_ID=MMETSP1334-20130426/73856_1 /TAXON_ID=127549 /ORGANISM="Calcidiscus leptoporus, Strain RCC1130" /LENGTH=79 /DNA_ID=CAMNT_0007403197 /DNA_START=29 /DNA_END=265 /DNA_ORIENTATION=+